MDIFSTPAPYTMNLSSNPSPAQVDEGVGEKFSAVLEAKIADRTDSFRSGQIEIRLDSRRLPSTVNYYDKAGNSLGTTGFSAPEIFRTTSTHNIPLTDLLGIGAQLDAAGIGYRPYELYKGTGSDHGIDFDDMVAGGLGTAYDWREDPNVDLKGESARLKLIDDKALAESLGLKKTQHVTHERGIDSNYFEPQESGDGTTRKYVSFNGNIASWHPTEHEAKLNAELYAGHTLVLEEKINISDRVRISSFELQPKIPSGKEHNNNLTFSQINVSPDHPVSGSDPTMSLFTEALVLKTLDSSDLQANRSINILNQIRAAETLIEPKNEKDSEERGT